MGHTQEEVRESVPSQPVVDLVTGTNVRPSVLNPVLQLQLEVAVQGLHSQSPGQGTVLSHDCVFIALPGQSTPPNCARTSFTRVAV